MFFPLVILVANVNIFRPILDEKAYLKLSQNGKGKGRIGADCAGKKGGGRVIQT